MKDNHCFKHMASIDQEIIKEANDWLNDHGQPTFPKLKRLAEMRTPEADELLRELADDYDVRYDEETPSMKLVDEIMLRVEEEGPVDGEWPSP